MEFRRLTSTDLRSLLELYNQLDTDNQCSAEQSESVWKEIEADANIRYFGAVDDGKVVSTCYAVYIPNLTRNNRGICFIENIVTDKAYRRLGLQADGTAKRIQSGQRIQHCFHSGHEKTQSCI